MLARRVASGSLALLALCWGCAADKHPVGDDGAVATDSGSATGDGSAGVDSGGRDASATDMDAGATDVDAGASGTDAGTSDTDAGTSDIDAGATDVDAGASGTDAGTTGTDAGTSDADAGGVCAGIECAGFPGTFVRGCTNDDSCVGEVHSRDCCNAERILGMNHSEAAAFCAAEATCRASYPASSGCTDSNIVTDTGSTPLRANVAARCADIDPSTGVGTCTTFVCGTAGGTPCPTARRIGACATITP